MIFIAKSDGTLSRVIPSSVNQGSVGVNELVLIAPYPKASAVTAAFILPNGIRTKPNLATLTEIADFIEGEHYNAWVFELTAAITEFAGNVTVQFFVTSGEKVLATYSDTFSVAKGAMPEPPGEITEDVYNDILTAYGEASARLTTAESDISSIKEDIGADYTYGTMKGRIYAAEMNIQNNTSEINYTKHRVSTNESDISAIEVAIGEDDEQSSIKGRIKTAEDDIDDLERRTGNLEDKASGFESDFVLVDGRLATLEGSASTAATAISALQTSLKNFGIFNRAEYNKTTNTIILWFVKNGNDQKVEIPLEDFLNTDELEDEIAAKISALTQEYQASIEQSEADAKASASSASTSEANAKQYEKNAGAHATAASTSATEAKQAKETADKSATSSLSSAMDSSYYATQAKASADKAEMYSQTSEDRWAVFDKRLTNVENGISADPFVTDDTVAYQKTAPASALPFAAIERVGGMSYKSKNLFNINATPTWNTNTINTLTKIDDVTFTTTNSNASGGGNGIYIGTFDAGVTITVSGYYKCSSTAASFLNIVTPKNGTGNLKKDIGTASEYTPFSHTFTTVDSNAEYYYRPAYATTNTSGMSITLKNVQIEIGSSATPYLPYFEGIRHAAVTAIESAGKNLFDNGNVNYTAGTGLNFQTYGEYIRINGTKVAGANIVPVTKPNIVLPVGTYTMSVRIISGMIARANTSSTDDGIYFGINSSGYAHRTTPHILSVGQVGTRTFTVTEPMTISTFDITCGYSGIGNAYENVVVACQLERAGAVTGFEPYVKETFPIPTTLTSLPYYGYGSNADVNNHIDYETTEYVQMCSERAYQSGDENNPEVVTDGTSTVYALTTPVRTPITFTDNYIRVGGSGTLTFVNTHKLAVPSTVLYLTKEASV
jgi:hypothetical protein